MKFSAIASQSPNLALGYWFDWVVSAFHVRQKHVLAVQSTHKKQHYCTTTLAACLHETEIHGTGGAEIHTKRNFAWWIFRLRTAGRMT